MPELRKDPIVGRWTIIAEERAHRPGLGRLASPRTSQAEQGICPFCAGHEHYTPPEIAAFRDYGAAANGPGWRVRVVPNRHPALKIEERLDKRGVGIYDRIAGVGAHEVVIETPNHHTPLESLPPEQIRDVLWMYRDRLLDLRNDRRFVHGMIFKNSGAAAGATLEHAHSQLLVAPVVPCAIQAELDGSAAFHAYRGRCIYCDITDQELADPRRVVLDTSHFLVFCPYASRLPFEIWIVPKDHSSHFEHIGKHQVDDLGPVLRETLAKLSAGLDAPAYQYFIHSAPFDQPERPHYHWHIELAPRLAPVDGYEWGSGCCVNSVAPETAAAYLREVDLRPIAPEILHPRAATHPGTVLV